MKTGMEILKEIRRLAVVEGQKAYSGPGGYSSGQASGLRVSGDLLEAWLGEAEIWVANNSYQAVKLLEEEGNQQVNAEDVLRDLLGRGSDG